MIDGASSVPVLRQLDRSDKLGSVTGPTVRIRFPPAKTPLQTRFQASLRPELDAGRLPDLRRPRRPLCPDPPAIPDITVALAPLHLYDELGTVRLGDAA